MHPCQQLKCMLKSETPLDSSPWRECPVDVLTFGRFANGIKSACSYMFVCMSGYMVLCLCDSIFLGFYMSMLLRFYVRRLYSCRHVL